MTTLTPIISSDYNPLAAAVMLNNSFVPVRNTERALFAQATFDIGTAAATGQNGATFISDTTTNTGSWYAIQILADTTFNILDCNWDGSSRTGIVFKDNHTVYGNFTRIKLTSGSVIAYKQ